MATLTEAERERIANITSMVMTTFFNAYYLHANGVSEAELLIDHDITAAGSDLCADLATASRNTVKAAVAAYDERIPFDEARAHLAQRLVRHIDKEMNKKPHQPR